MFTEYGHYCTYYEKRMAHYEKRKSYSSTGTAV